MTKIAAQNQDSPISPLKTLTTQFQTDMEQVNGIILESMQSRVPLIPKLASYLIAAGGKRIRPLLTLASTHMYDGDMAKAARLAAAVEFIHTATLLHDDVVDGSEERRGQKATNLVFGNEASVLVGDFLFSRAFELMVECDTMDVLRVLSRASAVIAEGEVMQLQTQNNINTSWAEYEEIVASKTAALFSAACEIGPILGGTDQAACRAMYDYGHYLGMAFQITDDVLDYAGGPNWTKQLGDDFAEGKLTAPAILAIEDGVEIDFWQRTLSDLNQTEKDFDTARYIVENQGYIQKSLDIAQDYTKKAEAVLPTDTCFDTLRALPRFILSRSR